MTFYYAQTTFQEPFTVLVKTVGESSQGRGRCWTIPLSYGTADGQWFGVQQRLWFPCVDENFPNEMNLPIENLQNNQWLIIDIELGGKSTHISIHWNGRDWSMPWRWTFNPSTNNEWLISIPLKGFHKVNIIQTIDIMFQPLLLHIKMVALEKWGFQNTVFL